MFTSYISQNNVLKKINGNDNDNNEFSNRVKTSTIAKLLLSIFVLQKERCLKRKHKCNTTARLQNSIIIIIGMASAKQGLGHALQWQTFIISNERSRSFQIIFKFR